MQLTHWQLNHENQSMVLNTDPPCMGSCCTRWSSVLSFHEEYAKLMYESTNDANVRGAATKQGRLNIIFVKLIERFNVEWCKICLASVIDSWLMGFCFK